LQQALVRFLVRSAWLTIHPLGMDGTFGAFLVGISGHPGGNLRGIPIRQTQSRLIHAACQLEASGLAQGADNGVFRDAYPVPARVTGRHHGWALTIPVGASHPCPHRHG
jgi:hypothetical protein